MILHEGQAGIHKKETCVLKRCLKLKGKINPCGVAETPAAIIKMRISLTQQFFILGYWGVIPCLWNGILAK